MDEIITAFANLTDPAENSMVSLYQFYKLFSLLSPDGQTAVINSLPESDRDAFRMCMASAKLFIDTEYKQAVCQSLAEILYKEFNS